MYLYQKPQKGGAVWGPLIFLLASSEDHPNPPFMAAMVAHNQNGKDTENSPPAPYLSADPYFWFMEELIQCGVWQQTAARRIDADLHCSALQTVEKSQNYSAQYTSGGESRLQCTAQ